MPIQDIGFAEEVRQIGGTHEALFALSAAHALSKARCEFERLEVVPFDVGPEGMELYMRPLYPDADEAIVRREADHKAMVARVDFEALHGDAAPVGIIGTVERGLLVVGGGLHRPCHKRAETIGTDDDTGLYSHR